MLAINLLARLTDRDMAAQCVSGTRRPGGEAQLTGSFKKSRISNMFRGSGSFMDAAPDSFGALLVDEAHRLNKKAAYGNQGEHQIKEIMQAARLSVFFVDEAQRVTLKDVGSRAEIGAGRSVWAPRLRSWVSPRSSAVADRTAIWRSSISYCKSAIPPTMTSSPWTTTFKWWTRAGAAPGHRVAQRQQPRTDGGRLLLGLEEQKRPGCGYRTAGAISPRSGT